MKLKKLLSLFLLSIISVFIYKSDAFAQTKFTPYYTTQDSTTNEITTHYTYTLTTVYAEDAYILNPLKDKEDIIMYDIQLQGYYEQPAGKESSFAFNTTTENGQEYVIVKVSKAICDDMPYSMQEFKGDICVLYDGVKVEDDKVLKDGFNPNKISVELSCSHHDLLKCYYYEGFGWQRPFGSVEPPCCVNGIEEDFCKICGLRVNKKEIQASGNHTHTYVRDYKKATKTQEGYSGDTYCSFYSKYSSKINIPDGTIYDADDYVKHSNYDVLVKKGYVIPKLVENETPTSTEQATTEKSTEIQTTEQTTEQATTEKSTESHNDNTEVETTESNTEKLVSNAKKCKVTVSSVKKSGKKLVIKLKKKTGYKYEIKVSTDKKFKKSVKTYKTSKTTYKTKNMKKGKTYYVKARTYKNISGKNVYGKWSNVKKIKIK